MSKWVLIDLSYLAHRARYVSKDLSVDDIPTGVLYMFFEQLITICRHPAVNSNKVLVFADSKRSWRAKAFADYKKARRKENRTPDEWAQITTMHEQVIKLRRKILPALGIQVCHQVGLESDDLIAWVAKTLTEKKQEAVMVTSDGDLFQCITPYVKWYDPSKNLMIGEHEFRKMKDLEPSQWGSVKSIAGCSTDCVPGLKGIGEKGAIKWLKGELPEHTKQFKTITENLKEVKKWAELVILPHKKTKSFMFHPPKYDVKAFFRFCRRFEILSYLQEPRKSQWKKFFKGIIAGGLKRRKSKQRKLI